MIEILQLLHRQNSLAPSYHGSFYIRLLDKDEPLPQFGHGIPNGPLLQRDWIWIAYRISTDEPVAMLTAAPAHGIVILLRIYEIKGGPRAAMLALLRRSLADMKERGYTRYVTFLDLERDPELKLIEIAKLAGATVEGGNHNMVTGPTDIGRL
jgi:hypothetical protein